MLKPHVVKNILEPTTNSVIKANAPTTIRKTISESTSSKMRYALETVVALGGGKAAYIDGYRVGGKTGTAQKVENGRYLENNYIMSFMSIVPANDPKVVFYIALDNPKNTALLSSYTTTPIARRVLLDIIDALDIPKQDNQIEKDWTWQDKVYYEVPNVVGMNVKEAKKLLTNFHVEYIGNGEKVVTQSAKAGERIPADDTIVLLLSEE